MRKLLFAAALLVAASTAHAQKVEFYGGYSYARVETASVSRSNVNGWNVALQGNYNDFFGIVGDFSGLYGTRTVAPGIERNVNTHMALFGPRIMVPGAIRPFAHALFGVARGNAGFFGGTGSETTFGMAAGGGIDVSAAPFIAIRLIQADYLMNRFFDRTNNNFRLSAGVVLRF